MKIAVTMMSYPIFESLVTLANRYFTISFAQMDVKVFGDDVKLM